MGIGGSTASARRRGSIFAAALLALLVSRNAAAAEPPGVVAVLPLDVGNAALQPADRMSLEESVRTIAGDELAPAGLTILTGENTLGVLADNGIDAGKACEASCALQAARELKARLFVSGAVATSEGIHVAFLRLYESDSGRQLASVKLEAPTVRELRAQFEKAAPRFFAKVKNAAASERGSAAPADPPPARETAGQAPRMQGEPAPVYFHPTLYGGVIRPGPQPAGPRTVRWAVGLGLLASDGIDVPLSLELSVRPWKHLHFHGAFEFALGGGSAFTTQAFKDNQYIGEESSPWARLRALAGVELEAPLTSAVTTLLGRPVPVWAALLRLALGYEYRVPTFERVAYGADFAPDWYAHPHLSAFVCWQGALEIGYGFDFLPGGTLTYYRQENDVPVETLDTKPVSALRHGLLVRWAFL